MPDGRSPEGGCPGCGFVTSWLADKAAAAGYNKVAGALDALASTDPIYANFQSTKALANADSGGDVVKALDPTGLTSLPETVSAAINGDERAQGQLAGGGALLLIGGKAAKLSRKNTTKNTSARARHHTDAQGAQGIMDDQAINPSRPVVTPRAKTQNKRL